MRNKTGISSDSLPGSAVGGDRSQGAGSLGLFVVDEEQRSHTENSDSGDYLDESKNRSRGRVDSAGGLCSLFRRNNVGEHLEADKNRNECDDYDSDVLLN
jgi:hypothetical protein